MAAPAGPADDAGMPEEPPGADEPQADEAASQADEAPGAGADDDPWSSPSDEPSLPPPPAAADPLRTPPPRAPAGAAGPAGPPVPPRRSRRWPERSTDRYVGGVAGGIARSLDVDPFVTRVAVAVAVAYLPWLVAVYALAWLVLRDSATGRSLLDDAAVPGRRLPALGVVALGVGALVLAPELGPGGDTGLTTGAVLLAAGYLLVTGQVGSGGDDGGGTPSSPPPARPPAGTWRRPHPLRPPRPPRPPRPASHLGWAGLSALVVLVGVAAVVDRVGPAVSPGVVVSSSLVLLGAVLCLGARWGRARLLVPVGVLLLPLWLALAASGVARYDGDGTAEYTVAADEPIPEAFRHGYGRLDVDLTRADLAPGEHRTVRIGLTAGIAQVHVPREAHLQVHGDVGMGDVEVIDGWSVWDSGLTLLTRVDGRVGDPVERCQDYPVAVVDPVDPVDPDDAFDPGATPPTTIEHYDTWTGEPCTPEPEPDPDDPDPEPAVLELVLDVGLGEVEIHREEP